MKRLFLMISVLLFIAGCYGDDIFERPSVVSVTPERDSTTVLQGAKITVVFSRSMDTVKTNEEFSLSSGSGSVDGFYSWDSDGKTLTFTPKSNLSMAEKYTIRITGSAEDSEGNDLDGEFLSVFFTGGDLGQPGVVSYTPAADSIGNAVNSTVSVTFSEAVSLNSIYSGITISPALEGTFSSDPGGTIITFIPRYGFRYGVTYTVNVGTGVKDSAGNSLLVPVSFRFTVGDDFTKPQLSAYQDLTPPLNLDESSIVHGAEKDRAITLDFSEVILTDNLENSVSISPSTPFYITSSTVSGSGVVFTRAIITFTEKLSCEDTYTLRISSVITDAQENPLDHDYRFVFVTDGVNSRSPVVLRIGDIQGDNSIAAWLPDVIPSLGVTVTGLYDNIGIDFTSPVNPSSLVIQVDTVAGQGSTTSVVNIDWPSVVTPAFTRVKFGLYKAASGNTYRIKIKGGKSGLKDTNGNYMKDDYIQIVRFP